MRADLGGDVLAVGLGEALGEVVSLDLVLLGADRLEHERREQAADLGRPLPRQAPGRAGQEPGAETVADAGRDRALACSLATGTCNASTSRPTISTPSRAQGGDPDVDLAA